MWVPSKSALERESWDWNREEEQGGGWGPGRRVGKSDGGAKRHSKERHWGLGDRGSEVMGD